MLTTISFPGLGIDNFTINPVAFTIPIFGGLEVRWYGILITIGIILAFTYCAYRSKQEGIIFDDLLDIAIFTVIFGVIGARAGYVLFSLDSYTKYLETDGFWTMVKKMISINEGGLQIYGAVIVGAITIMIVCKVKKINYVKMLDSVAPAVMIGQILGRWGNFMNVEAYGSPTTLPWRMCSPKIAEEMLSDELVTKTDYLAILNGELGAHPTFLYESLWNLVGFILIHFIYKKKKFDGQIALMYLTWYGFGRMFIEMLRTDQLKLGVFPVSVVIGFICFVGGTTLLIIGFVKAKRKKITEGEYIPTYAKISHYGETTMPIENKEEAIPQAEITPEERQETSEEEEEEEKDELVKKLSSLLEDENKDNENKE